jgi:hypothetical protein
VRPQGLAAAIRRQRLDRRGDLKATALDNLPATVGATDGHRIIGAIVDARYRAKCSAKEDQIFTFGCLMPATRCRRAAGSRDAVKSRWLLERHRPSVCTRQDRPDFRWSNLAAESACHRSTILHHYPEKQPVALPLRPIYSSTHRVSIRSSRRRAASWYRRRLKFERTVAVTRFRYHNPRALLLLLNAGNSFSQFAVDRIRWHLNTFRSHDR